MYFSSGREAALFTLDLWKMYERLIKRSGWKVTSVSTVDNPDGGFRHVAATISGQGVFGGLQHETGVHRVQRIPETEAQGRVHTSTSVVVVMPEPTKQDLPEINDGDIKVDTFKVMYLDLPVAYILLDRISIVAISSLTLSNVKSNIAI